MDEFHFTWHVATRRWFSTALIAMLFCAVTALAGAQPSRAAGNPNVLSILAMGDSYTAGNGAGGYYGAKGCRRSAYNYAREFERIVERPPHNQRAFVENVACSGNVTYDFFRTSWDRPPQIQAVNKGYDIVFLTIGGNDLNFSSIVKQCLVAKTRRAEDCALLLAKAKRDLNDGQLEQRISEILDSIRKRAAPAARVVLLGYPNLEGDVNYKLRFKSGGLLKVGQFLRDIQDAAEIAQERVVGRLNLKHLTNNFVFVKTKRTFAGHELFAKSNNDDRWFIQPFLDAEVWDRDLFYHPNYWGWKAEAELLAGDSRVPKHDVGSGTGSTGTTGSVKPYIYFARVPSAEPFWNASAPTGYENQVELFANLFSAGQSGYFCFEVFSGPSVVGSPEFTCNTAGLDWSGTIDTFHVLWRVYGTGDNKGPNGGYSPWAYDPSTTHTIRWIFTPTSGPAVTKDITFTTLSGPI